MEISLPLTKKQSSGGQLDIQSKDLSDNSMYEVEVILGEIDSSHIIRAIEYWDNEKKEISSETTLLCFNCRIFRPQIF